MAEAKTGNERWGSFQKRQQEKGLKYIHIWVPEDQSDKYKTQAKRSVKKHLKNREEV